MEPLLHHQYDIWGHVATTFPHHDIWDVWRHLLIMIYEDILHSFSPTLLYIGTCDTGYMKEMLHHFLNMIYGNMWHHFLSNIYGCMWHYFFNLTYEDMWYHFLTLIYKDMLYDFFNTMYWYVWHHSIPSIWHMGKCGKSRDCFIIIKHSNRSLK